MVFVFSLFFEEKSIPITYSCSLEAGASADVIIFLFLTKEKKGSSTTLKSSRFGSVSLGNPLRRIPQFGDL